MQLFQKSRPLHSFLPRPIGRTAAMGIISSVLLVGLTGCQASKGLFERVEDGSLEYQQATQVPPLQLPADQQTAPFTPLYPTPTVSANTLELKNDTGKRYQLPPPYRTVPTVPTVPTVKASKPAS